MKVEFDRIAQYGISVYCVIKISDIKCDGDWEEVYGFASYIEEMFDTIPNFHHFRITPPIRAEKKEGEMDIIVSAESEKGSLYNVVKDGIVYLISRYFEILSINI